jgi:hypothetical protein
MLKSNFDCAVELLKLTAQGSQAFRPIATTVVQAAAIKLALPIPVTTGRPAARGTDDKPAATAVITARCPAYTPFHWLLPFHGGKASAINRFIWGGVRPQKYLPI